MDIRAVAKVELHRHLEGSIRLQTIIEESHRAGLLLPAETPDGLAPHALIQQPVGSLEEALERFSIAQNAIRATGAVCRIAREAVEDLAQDNVRLAELRFSPDFLCRPGGLDWDAGFEAIQDGIDQARQAGSDVEVGLIAIASRDYGLDSARATVDFALRHADGLVGFDLAGTEMGYPARMYRDVLAPLAEAGLGLTVHYGESGPPAYAREAIEVLAPSRLGHGLSVAGDPSVVDLAIERGVTLEMCPTSNWLTRGVSSVDAHPARALLHRGVRVTLNSDDPGLFGIDLSHEWEVARDLIGFTDRDFAAVTANALEASFLPEDATARARSRHFGWVDAGIDQGP